MTSNAKTVIPWRRCLHSLKLMHRRICSSSFSIVSRLYALRTCKDRVELTVDKALICTDEPAARYATATSTSADIHLLLYCWRRSLSESCILPWYQRRWISGSFTMETSILCRQLVRHISFFLVTCDAAKPLIMCIGSTKSHQFSY